MSMPKKTRVSSDQAAMLIECLDSEEHDPPIPYLIENRSTTASSLARKGLAIRIGMRLDLTQAGRDEAWVQREAQQRRERKVVLR